MSIISKTDSDLLPDGNQSGSAPGDRKYRPDIQGLRGLIVVLSMFYHAQLFGVSGGYAGMDVFFVISGFVMTGILLRERVKTGKTSFASFYARRIRRILPMACLVIVSVVAATYYFLGTVQGAQTALSGFWSSLFLGNFHAIATNSSYFNRGSATSPLLAFWSLGAEEQFYIIYPAIFAIAAMSMKRYSLRIRLAVGLGAIVVFSLSYAIFYTHQNPIAAYYSPFTRFWEFAVGGLIAVCTPLFMRINRNVAAVLTWIGLAAILILFFTYNDGMTYPGYTAIPPVAAAVLVIGGGMHGHRNGAERLLGKKGMTAAGDVSYSLYLWHFPILIIAAEAMSLPMTSVSVVDRLLCIGLAVILSIISYNLVENPMRHSKWLSAKMYRTFIMGSTITLATAIMCGVLYFGYGNPSSSGKDASVASGSLAQLQAEITKSAAFTTIPYNLTPRLDEIDSTTSINYTPPNIPSRCLASQSEVVAVSLCPGGNISSKKNMVVYGDSQSIQWLGSFDKLAKSNNEKLYFFSKVGCEPWMTPGTTVVGPSASQCQQFAQFATSKIKALHPQQIFVVGGKVVTEGYQPERDDPYIIGLLRSMKMLSPVVVTLSNIPWTDIFPPICLSANAGDISKCNIPISDVYTVQNRFHEGLQKDAAAARVTDLNITPLFCDTRTCPRVVSNVLVYADSNHFTWQYDNYISNAFIQIATPTLTSQPHKLQK